MQTLSLRFDRLDVFRAICMLWMAGFHFCFDLNYYGFIKQDFYADPLWVWQRLAIVALFLFCAGFSLAVGLQQGQSLRRFARRWLQLAGCALLVSFASWWMFPRSYITFGVLHGIAVMLVLARLTAPAGRWLWPLGLAALLLPLWLQHPWFDSRATNWIGLVTYKPATEDFVPLLPWVGVVWWGLATGQWVLKHQPSWIAGALPEKLKPLSLLGRWPLSFYMLHQPVLMGVLMLFTVINSGMIF